MPVTKVTMAWQIFFGVNVWQNSESPKLETSRQKILGIVSGILILF